MKCFDSSWGSDSLVALRWLANQIATSDGSQQPTHICCSRAYRLIERDKWNEEYASASQDPRRKLLLSFI